MIFRRDRWTASGSAYSLAKAFRTSAREILNCRAICVGLMPALNAARTALILEGVKVTPTLSAGRLLETAGGFPPRRFCSASATAIYRSSSSSLSCLMAPGKSFGRTYRNSEGTGVFLSAHGAAFTLFAESEEGS
jgi:hypothetical protein